MIIQAQVEQRTFFARSPDNYRGAPVSGEEIAFTNAGTSQVHLNCIKNNVGNINIY